MADDRTNSVLLSGEASQRLRMRALIAHLDTPLESGGDTQVRYLRYADAEKIAAKLKEQAQGTAAAVAGGGQACRGHGRRPFHHDLGRAGDECADHHGTTEGHAHR